MTLLEFLQSLVQKAQVKAVNFTDNFFKDLFDPIEPIEPIIHDDTDFDELLEEEAPAAGAQGGLGHNFVRNDRIVEEVNPPGFEFPGTARDVGEIELGKAQGDEDEEADPFADTIPREEDDDNTSTPAIIPDEPITDDEPPVEPDEDDDTPDPEVPPDEDDNPPEPPVNDVPVAVDDIKTVEEGQEFVSNVLTNDDAGNDSPTYVSNVEGATVDENNNWVIETEYGVLTVSPTGLYSYASKEDSIDQDVQETFTYRITDNNGDHSYANIIINITNEDPIDPPPPPPEDEDDDDPPPPPDDEEDENDDDDENDTDPPNEDEDEDEDDDDEDPDDEDDDQEDEEDDDDQPDDDDELTGQNPGNDKEVGNSPWDGETGASGKEGKGKHQDGIDTDENQPGGKEKGQNLTESDLFNDSHDEPINTTPANLESEIIDFDMNSNKSQSMDHNPTYDF